LGKSRIGVEHVCISDRVSDLFRNTLEVSDDRFVPPPWLLANLRAVINLPVQTPLKPPIMFDTSPEALAHNTKLLADYSLDFVALMGDLQATTVGYNSEFRPVSQLRLRLGGHPHFPYLEEMAKHGMEYKFSSEITENERVSELTAKVARGNHKSAEAASQVTAALFNKDVRHGFSFAFDPLVVPRMPHALVQPCGMVLQHTLQEDESRPLFLDRRSQAVRQQPDGPVRVPGHGLRVVPPAHTPFYCRTTLGVPGSQDLHLKMGFLRPYRRIAHAAISAVQSVVIFSGIAYLALRMTYGGSANPPAWYAFSEMVTDLANESLYASTSTRTPSPVRTTNLRHSGFSTTTSRPGPPVSWPSRCQLPSPHTATVSLTT
jgi:hypothetical protein